MALTPIDNRRARISQILRDASEPVTATQIAKRLFITERTIYRDIAAMKACGSPIEGAAGMGYVMRRK